MQQHTLNLQKSIEIFNECRHCIQPRQCYTNINWIVSTNIEEFISGQWRVAYGYYLATPKIPNLLARHCFVLDENNTVIDPTLLTTHEVNDNLADWKYFSMKIFDNFKEYLEALVIEQYASLDKTLRQHDLNAWEWAKTNNYLLLT